ncbi:DNA invertase Pin-like site-specific DNA recombinase [Sinomonas atrocyanea]|nr:DNA invertase Pin-like site-specific DNA recombinase [Sinomonas atrocyanea]
MEVFTDNDVSAYSSKTRPGYAAMLARLSEVEAVICWHTDRLHRSPVELEQWISATGGDARARVLTLTVQAGELDLNTADGRLRARISGAVARHESERKAERARRKMEELARSGKWTGGTRPFGWEVNGGALILKDDEAAVVREATAAVIRGRSLGSLVTSLNERGILTTAGKPWGYAQLRQMLLRPRNAGIATYHNEEIGRLEAPALVSEAQYRAVVAVLTDPRRRRSQSNKARHLLSGIARCHCGRAVRSGTVSDRSGRLLPTYRCPARGGGHVGKRIAYVDPHVEQYALLVLSLIDAGGVDTADPAEGLELEAEALALDARSNAIAEQIASGAILPEQIARVNAALTGQREDLQRRMAEAERQAGSRLQEGRYSLRRETLERTLAAWNRWSIDERRDFVRARLDVVLLPSRGGSSRMFDPSTVHVRLANERGDGLEELFQLLGPVDEQLSELQEDDSTTLVSVMGFNLARRADGVYALSYEIGSHAPGELTSLLRDHFDETSAGKGRPRGKD